MSLIRYNLKKKKKEFVMPKVFFILICLLQLGVCYADFVFLLQLNVYYSENKS